MNENPWHAVDVAEVLRVLAADPERGLTPAEAAKRLREHGPNELTHQEKASAWAIFFGQFTSILIVILIVTLNFCSLRYSILKVPPFKWLLIAIGWELALIWVLLQFDAVRDSFGIAMPTLLDIGVIFGFGAVVMITVEIVKAFLRGRANGRALEIA